MTLASMFATVRQGASSLLAGASDRQLRVDVEATARRSDDLSIIHYVKSERRAWMAEIARLDRVNATLRSSLSLLSDRIMEMEDRITKLEKGEAKR